MLPSPFSTVTDALRVWMGVGGCGCALTRYLNLSNNALSGPLQFLTNQPVIKYALALSLARLWHGLRRVFVDLTSGRYCEYCFDSLWCQDTGRVQ